MVGEELIAASRTNLLKSCGGSKPNFSPAESLLIDLDQEAGLPMVRRDIAESLKTRLNGLKGTQRYFDLAQIEIASLPYRKHTRRCN